MTAARASVGLRWACAGVLGLALSLQAAHAGRSCDAPQPPKATMVQSAMTLAERTANALTASGAQVVVLARAGQDLSKYNLRYSHLGLAYKQPDGQGGHVWRVLHKLNQCGTAESAIYRQGLGDFFLDDLWRFEAAWVVPNPAAQASLLALLNDPVRSLQLHHQPYNMLAYPWSQKYQQSNQWALETMAVALSADATSMGGASRSFAQAWLQGKGYQPTVLNISAMTRLGARVSKANIAFDDHPNDKRFSDRIETVTVDSVFTWMNRAGLGAAPARLGL
jgi:hypothetical protein